MNIAPNSHRLGSPHAFLGRVVLIVASVSAAATADDVRLQEFMKDYTRRSIHELVITFAEDANAPLQLNPRPILNWSNLRNGYFGGQIFVWLKDERPAVMGGMLHWPKMQQAVLEFVNLTPEPVVATRDSNVVWQGAERNSITWHVVPDVAPPSKSPSVRLVQMRRIAGDFTARAIKQPPDYEENSIWELRFVTQPLYRYQPTRGKVVDGAIFSYCIETDPEAILMLEAHQTPDQSLEWRFAFARVCAWEIRAAYRDKAVWSVQRLYYPLPQGKAFYQTPIPVSYPSPGDGGT